ncbi:MAG: putative quinol monooxygenase [Ornithinimicrobium sp.]
MSELHVIATIPARADAVDQVRVALQELARATQAEEGCHAYDLYESGAAEGTFVTVERWRSQADLDAHLASEHVAAAFATAGPLLAGEVAIHPLTPVE